MTGDGGERMDFRRLAAESGVEWTAALPADVRIPTESEMAVALVTEGDGTVPPLSGSSSRPPPRSPPPTPGVGMGLELDPGRVQGTPAKNIVKINCCQTTARRSTSVPPPHPLNPPHRPPHATVSAFLEFKRKQEEARQGLMSAAMAEVGEGGAEADGTASGASSESGTGAERPFDMEKDGWEDADCPCSDM